MNRPESYKNLFTHKGFLKSAKDYNKRAQILFTAGIAGNTIPEGLIKGLTDKGNLKFIVVNDHKIEQLTDGVFSMRDDVLKWHGRDSGIFDGAPGGDGHVKSFIVRKGQLEGEIGKEKNYGGLLGKYMGHSSGKNLSKWMEDNGIHGIIFKSGAKQMGLRDTHTYEQYKKGEIN